MRAVGQLRREGGGQVVAARFDDHHLQTRKLLFQLGDGGEVDAGILADGAVRAAAGLDADDPVQRQDLAPGQELGVLARVDVVGDDRQVDRRPECATELFDQGRLAGADRSADAEGEDTPSRGRSMALPPSTHARQSAAHVRRGGKRAAVAQAQDRKSRVYKWLCAWQSTS